MCDNLLCLPCTCKLYCTQVRTVTHSIEKKSVPNGELNSLRSDGGWPLQAGTGHGCFKFWFLQEQLKGIIIICQDCLRDYVDVW